MSRFIKNCLNECTLPSQGDQIIHKIQHLYRLCYISSYCLLSNPCGNYQKTMGTGSNQSKRPRIGVRQSLQLIHASEEPNAHLDSLKQALTLGSSDNLSSMTKLVEIAKDPSFFVSSNVFSTSKQLYNFLNSAGKHDTINSA